MTEDEAKTKWCPFARAVLSDGSDQPAGATFNRWIDANPDEPELPVTRCIGSACMAWRKTVPGKSIPEHGYCGLAGKL